MDVIVKAVEAEIPEKIVKSYIWDAMNDLFEELEVDWKDIIILDHDRVKDWIESGGEK